MNEFTGFDGIRLFFHLVREAGQRPTRYPAASNRKQNMNAKSIRAAKKRKMKKNHAN